MCKVANGGSLAQRKESMANRILNDGSIHFKLTPRESEAVAALKAACEASGIQYKSTFELVKYALASFASVDKKDPNVKEKRLQIALERIKQRREADQASYGASAAHPQPSPAARPPSQPSVATTSDHYSIYVSEEFCLALSERRLRQLLELMPLLEHILLGRPGLQPEAPKQAADGTLNFKLELPSSYGISKDDFLYLIHCVFGLHPLPCPRDERFGPLVDAITKLGGCPPLEAELKSRHADPHCQPPANQRTSHVGAFDVQIDSHSFNPDTDTVLTFDMSDDHLSPEELKHPGIKYPKKDYQRTVSC